jgi:hypothetical protein
MEHDIIGTTLLSLTLVHIRTETTLLQTYLELASEKLGEVFGLAA